MRVAAIVVDDEAVERRRMTRLLGEREDVDVVAECAGGQEALEAIAKQQPALVLLDVQMPDIDGFEVCRRIEAFPLPAIVFVTAYDQHALRAFEVAATDYLLKPYESDRFHQAVDRAVAQIGQRDVTSTEEHIRRLLRAVVGDERATDDIITADAPEIPREQIAVKNQGRTQFLKLEEVDWIESDGNYLRIHSGQRSHLIRGTISSWTERLNKQQFIRIHRRFLVNVDRIKEVQPWFAGDCIVFLRDGTKLRLSRTYREAFQEQDARRVIGRPLMSRRP
jgi:two-component system, LytTR family, response regulator